MACTRQRSPPFLPSSWHVKTSQKYQKCVCVTMFNDDVSTDESTDEEDIIRDFDQEAGIVINEKIIPSKSVNRYNLVYETFLKWRWNNKTNSFEENILICYFKDLQKKVNPATMWSVWSMLKKMLNIKHNVDISKYLNLKAILKNNSKGHKAKKSSIFSWNEISEFINNASDDIHLGAKILLIFGICGALRCVEFTNIKFSNVEDKNDKFIVSIQDTKTYIDRYFVIGPLYYNKVKKYISLRPPGEYTDKFFLQYSNGKCTRQVVGKNKIGSTPSIIVTYLKLNEPSRYTGHCFRRSSATLLSNSGANMNMVKQLGGWKSDSVAAGYIAESLRSKNLIYQGITHENRYNNCNSKLNQPSTSKINCDKILTNNNSIINEQIDELDIKPEDFQDLIDEVLIEQNDGKKLSLNSTSENKRPLHTTLCIDENANTNSKLFTDKPPITLSFTNPNKKLKTQDLEFDSTKTNCVQGQLKNKDFNIVFENCTVNGNIYNYCTFSNTNDSNE